MSAARYGLRGDNRMPPLAQWQRMDGFFVGRESAYDAYETPAEEPATVQAVLHGVDWLDAATDRPTRTLELGEAVLDVRTASGHVLGDYSLWDTRLLVPAGSSEATLVARVGTLPHAGAEWVWDLWATNRPGSVNLWAQLPVGEREAWLEVAQIVSFRENRLPYPALRERIDVDGTHVEDLASLFCALGEAVEGPGGFCGASVAGLADCLRYAPRSTGRPQLIWHEFAVAEKTLARRVETDNGPARYLDLVLAVLGDGGVEVLPA
jgi:hypothetical protein